MVQLNPLDEHVPIFHQLNADVSPVVFVNLLTVSEPDIPALLKAWEDDANCMKKQPGYISTQLHRGIAGSTVFMNYAVWESVAHFRAAFTYPDFNKALGACPTLTFLLRRTTHDDMRRSRPEKILNVFQLGVKLLTQRGD